MSGRENDNAFAPPPAEANAASPAHLNPGIRAGIHVVRLSAVTAVLVGLFEEYYESVGVVVRDTPEAVQQIVEGPDGGVWLAYRGEEAVGCVYLRRLPSIPFAAECKRLYVKPSVRGHGVAQRLLEALEAHAKAKGFKQIYLDSKDDLQVAIRLYTRRGYVPCERYNDNPQATVFMVKNIEQLP